MFQIEKVDNPVAINLKNRGISGLISVLPLDKIPVEFPSSWSIKPTCMPEAYASRAEDFANFEVRKDDVWVVTYPKCGTTWTQEMTWMLMNNINFDEANSIDISQRSIFFELEGLIEPGKLSQFEVLQNQKSPRVIKTHLPIGLLPRDIWRKKCKIIYVTRDPKDAIVSFYHHVFGTSQYNGSLEEFSEGIVTDNIIYCSLWNHFLEFWLIREQNNILFLTFEDMKKDLKTVLEKTSEFLDKSYNENQIQQLMDHLSFDKMKANPTCNNQYLVKKLINWHQVEYKEKNSFKFMRKGQVGGYKEELPLSYMRRINAKTKEIFQPYGLNLYCDDNN